MLCSENYKKRPPPKKKESLREGPSTLVVDQCILKLKHRFYFDNKYLCAGKRAGRIGRLRVGGGVLSPQNYTKKTYLDTYLIFACWKKSTSLINRKYMQYYLQYMYLHYDSFVKNTSVSFIKFTPPLNTASVPWEKGQRRGIRLSD